VWGIGKCVENKGWAIINYYKEEVHLELTTRIASHPEDLPMSGSFIVMGTFSSPSLPSFFLSFSYLFV
jgi:hypothetical protein